MDDLSRFRAEKDAFYRQHPQSPLTPEQRVSFTGLRYFPPNPALVFLEQVTPASDREPFTIDTSTGDRQTFQRAGTVTITAEGEQASVTLLSRVGGHGHGLFLPFRDATSGKESYPAGRYLDLAADDILPDGQVRIDFNLAYNPYCAYNDRYSCPLPPPENWLSVPIRAGEMAFSTAAR